MMAFAAQTLTGIVGGAAGLLSHPPRPRPPTGRRRRILVTRACSRNTCSSRSLDCVRVRAAGRLPPQRPTALSERTWTGTATPTRLAIDRAEPSVLHVWLSTTGATHLIRSPRALLRIAATDVDGDHRPELIATEASASELRVWKRDGPRRGFEPYTPPRAPDHAAPSPKVRTLGGTRMTSKTPWPVQFTDHPPSAATDPSPPAAPAA